MGTKMLLTTASIQTFMEEAIPRRKRGCGRRNPDGAVLVHKSKIIGPDIIAEYRKAVDPPIGKWTP